MSELSIDFYPGEVCSLLGHNGAGKTTATFILVGRFFFPRNNDREIHVGMLEPTSGQVFVDGLDYRTHSEQIRQRIGFCPQAGSLSFLASRASMTDSRYSLRSAVCRGTSTTDGSSENLFHDDQPRDGHERLIDASYEQGEYECYDDDYFGSDWIDGRSS